MGLEWAGFRIAWQCESDPFCRALLAEHWPGVPCYDDVRTLSNAPQVDCLVGGFPCQPVSVAGRRKAQADPRWLWPAFVRVIAEQRPPLVCIENVPGLRTAGLRDVLADLAGLGFDAEWTLIRACDFGAPHIRARLFLVATDTNRPELRLEPGWLGRAYGSGATQLGDDGEDGALADPERLRELQSQGGECEEWRRPWRGRRQGTLGDTAGTGPSDRTAQAERSPALTGEPERSGWWTTEPDVGRVAHGIPARVDRLRGLGNAIVPAKAYWLGRQLYQLWERLT